MARVLIAGVTGNIGFEIALATTRAGHSTAGFFGPSDNSNPAWATKLTELQSNGVRVLDRSLDDELGNLVQLIKDFDTIISALPGIAHEIPFPTLDCYAVSAQAQERKLLQAAKEAGTVKRYIPASFGGNLKAVASRSPPPVQANVAASETLLEDILAAGMSYTIFSPHAFFTFILPRLGTVWRPSNEPPPDTAEVYGDGNVKCGLTAEADIAAVIAKGFADPRTANKKVVFYGQALSQKEVIKTWKHVSGKEVSLKALSEEALLKELTGDPGPLREFELGYARMFWLCGGEYTYKELGEGELWAKDLYPELKFKTVEDFYQQQIVG